MCNEYSFFSLSPTDHISCFHADEFSNKKTIYLVVVIVGQLKVNQIFIYGSYSVKACCNALFEQFCTLNNDPNISELNKL